MIDAETAAAKAQYDEFVKGECADGHGLGDTPRAYTVKCRSTGEILYWGFDLDEAKRVAAGHQL